MPKKFPKKYNPDFEPKIYQYWEKKSYFSPEKLEEIKWKLDDRFVISMPPPNVTWVLHLWHAVMLAIEDAMIRYNRLKWKKTLWIPWTDHAWIATQVVVEKQLAEKKLTRHDLGREKFLNKVWDWVKYSRSTIISQIKKMWSSCDWSREQFTLSEKLSRAVRKSFSNLYQRWKIYKSNYIVNWCPRCQTVLSDIEVKYKEEKWKLYYIRYFVEGKGSYITVATTRPETMFGDVAVAVHPKDKRYKKFIWKNVLIPIVNVPIPVIADEHVDPTFGTWALKITPTHDPDDFEIAQRHNLPMNKYAIDKQGKFTSEAGPDFAWRDVYQDFDRVIRYLEEIDNLEKVEEHVHKVPYCDRCWTRIQPMVSLQWFVDVSEAAQASIEAVKSWVVKIHPDRFNKTYFDWLENIKPWCISRQLRWGHRIPVWQCESNHINVFDDEKVLELIWNKKWNAILTMIIFNLIADSRLKPTFSLEQLIDLLFSSSLTPQEWKVLNVYLKIYQNKYSDNSKLTKNIKELQSILEEFEKSDNLDKAWEQILEILEKAPLIDKKWDEYSLKLICQDCGSSNLKQDEDVLDTWFSSALWPFSILWWPEKTQDMKLYYPNDVMETGYDILFFRVARMMMMAYENLREESSEEDSEEVWREKKNTEENIKSQTIEVGGDFSWIPFKDIYLHWLVRDSKGEKMSKSKWNVVDPLEIIKEYGADSLRLALLIGNTPGNDLRFSKERVDYAHRFLNKLWNASRFVYMNIFWKDDLSDITFDFNSIKEDIQNNLDKLNEFDSWILYKLNELIDTVERYMDKFMLGEAISEIVKFAWNNYCDWYIEISKVQKSDYTDKVLIYTLWAILKLLHSFAPFVTEKLRRLINFEWDLIISDLPTTIDEVDYDAKVDLFMDVITEFRNLRNKLWLKPHETADVIVQSNTTFMEFIKKFEILFKKLLNVDNLILTRNPEFDSEYSVAVVFDTKLGLKGKRKLSIKQQIELLEKKLKEEQMFAQSLRATLANEAFLSRAPKQVVEQKQEKLKEVEEKILKLELEIRKLKAKIK